jgi:hypothetical protein
MKPNGVSKLNYFTVNNKKREEKSMEMLDEIIKRVHHLNYHQQKKVLKDLQSLQEGEKRRYQRRMINTNIDAVVGDRVIQSDTRDISASGVYIRTTAKLKNGKGIQVVFILPSHRTPFKLKGELIRAEQKGIAIKFEDQKPYYKRIFNDAIWLQKETVYP